MSKGLHVVLGASGGAGRAICNALVERGHEVRGVARTTTNTPSDVVQNLAADISAAKGAHDAVTGASVVYMAAQPAYTRWVSEFPPMLRSVIDAVGDEGARLVMVDNLYMYAPGVPLVENSPEDNETRKGRVRVHMSRMLRDAHDAGRTRVTIGRASDYFGPRSGNSAITTLVTSPGAQGKPMRWLGRLDKRHSAAYLPDIARAYAMLGESEAAEGDTWILPHADAPTGAEFMAATNRTLPKSVKSGPITKPMLLIAAPFNKQSRETLELLYQWTQDFVVDDSKFRRHFGPFRDTPIDEAIAATITSARDAVKQ